MDTTALIEGTGTTLEDAVQAALKKVPSPEGADRLIELTVSEWGYSTGGFTGKSNFWVKASYTVK